VQLRFKLQRYQTEAVDAVADCFAGQPGPGDWRLRDRRPPFGPPDSGGGNGEIALSPARLLANIQAVQRARGLPVSPALAPSPGCAPGTPSLDVEMETGTGKTYVYTKTIMELNRRYGWSRFVIVVPSLAIREGVRKSFEVTAAHFRQAYGRAPLAFSYSSAQLHELARFAADPGVHVMIINIQAFNAASQDSRRIYEELDELQSRRPIDMISASQPVVIIDEPQRTATARSLAALSRLSPLMLLRYSATHRVEHNKVYRLDARDAYNQRLVKRIAVRGITARGLAGRDAYLYLAAIEVAPGARPRARAELEVRTRSGVSRQTRLLSCGASLYTTSGGLAVYRGLSITDIDAVRGVIELSSGDVVAAGQVTTDGTEAARRRLQISEVIRAHLDKERQLYPLGIKVLSLLFIDEVAKYRDYSRADTRGEYARVFAEQYAEQVAELLGPSAADQADAPYLSYLAAIGADDTHRGYFCVDARTGRLVDNPAKRPGDRGHSADADAYDLILRDRERLLSLSEPVRFIFSHSALREGWDNPNVFVLGMLKKSDSTVSRRQEIGRGLRLSVNSRGDRMDDPATVHEINELTVVTDESYTDFVAGLQRELTAAGPGARPGPPLPADDRKRPAARERWRSPPPAASAADEVAELDSAGLVRRCAAILDTRLHVEALHYLLEHGAQRPAGHGGFTAEGAETRAATAAALSPVGYDLLGEISHRTRLTRRTVAAILGQVSPATFGQYQRNPEQFIAECARLVGEQLGSACAG
jgi:type III restriction enzyme